jgi:hypothetical protein
MVPGARELMHHLHQVILRNPVGSGDFGNRGEAVAAQREEHQHAQGVVGKSGQPHVGTIRSISGIYYIAFREPGCYD